MDLALVFQVALVCYEDDGELVAVLDLDVSGGPKVWK